MGAFAADHLIDGESGMMVGLQGNKLESWSLEEALARPRPLDLRLLELSDVMD
jgi:hypothetical protein